MNVLHPESRPPPPSPSHTRRATSLSNLPDSGEAVVDHDIVMPEHAASNRDVTTVETQGRVESGGAKGFEQSGDDTPMEQDAMPPPGVIENDYATWTVMTAVPPPELPSIFECSECGIRNAAWTSVQDLQNHRQYAHNASHTEACLCAECLMKCSYPKDLQLLPLIIDEAGAMLLGHEHSMPPQVSPSRDVQEPWLAFSDDDGAGIDENLQENTKEVPTLTEQEPWPAASHNGDTVFADLQRLTTQQASFRSEQEPWRSVRHNGALDFIDPQLLVLPTHAQVSSFPHEEPWPPASHNGDVDMLSDMEPQFEFLDQ